VLLSLSLSYPFNPPQQHHHQQQIAAYFQRFDEAEEIYRDMDRNDLAIDLRKRLGDWFRVVQLVQSGAGDDELLQLAWNKIGQLYFSRQKYDKAMQYYQQAKNVEYLITCYFKLENYEALKELIKELPDGSKHLIRIGDLLQRVGLHRSAVEAFIKCEDIKAAVDCCVRRYLLYCSPINQSLTYPHKHTHTHTNIGPPERMGLRSGTCRET